MWQSSTLWTHYSMIRSTILLNDNIDITQYRKVTALLKRKNDSYIPKKSKVLDMDSILSFLKNATYDTYLFKKVVLIFGIHGACRKSELCNLMVSDIENTGSMAVVTLRDTKTKRNRIFVVTNECNGYDYFKTYFALRPQRVKHDRFFLQYRMGKCSTQPAGINTFSKIPQQIAEFLNLNNTNLYTGHYFRRTSTTLLANSGVDVQVLKRHGGWRSTKTAEGYVEENIHDKISISKKIFDNVRIM